MIQNVLQSLGGVGNYGVISLCLFCLVFLGALVWTLTRTRAHLEHMAQLPLENEPDNSNHGDNRDA
jgi:hypothetical protein